MPIWCAFWFIMISYLSVVGHLITESRQIELVLNVVLVDLTEKLVATKATKPRDPGHFFWRWHSSKDICILPRGNFGSFFFNIFVNLAPPRLGIGGTIFIRNRVGCKVCTLIFLSYFFSLFKYKKSASYHQNLGAWLVTGKVGNTGRREINWTIWSSIVNIKRRRYR